MDPPPPSSPPRPTNRAYDWAPTLTMSLQGGNGSVEGSQEDDLILFSQMVSAGPLDDLSTLGDDTFSSRDRNQHMTMMMMMMPPGVEYNAKGSQTEVIHSGMEELPTPRDFGAGFRAFFRSRVSRSRKVFLSPRSIFNDELDDEFGTITTTSSMEERVTVRRVYCFVICCSLLLLGAIIGSVFGFIRMSKDGGSSSKQMPLQDVLEPSVAPSPAPTLVSYSFESPNASRPNVDRPAFVPTLEDTIPPQTARAPTQAPILTRKPFQPSTHEPVAAPTVAPTFAPNSNPTGRPPQVPSVGPTRTPVMTPATVPTMTTRRPTVTRSPMESVIDRPLVEFPSSFLNPRDAPALTREPSAPTTTPLHPTWTWPPTALDIDRPLLENPSSPPGPVFTREPSPFSVQDPTFVPTRMTRPSISNPTRNPPSTMETEWPTPSSATATDNPTEQSMEIPGGEGPVETPTRRPVDNDPPADTSTRQPTVTSTDSPTRRPIEDATPSPTRRPIEQDTPSPTRRPVEVDTPSPTRRPVEVDTPSPTRRPIEVDTPSPTRRPVDVETPSPTRRPVDVDTPSPTRRPVEVDTPRPTRRPVDEDTRSPTKRPAEEPKEEDIPSPPEPQDEVAPDTPSD